MELHKNSFFKNPIRNVITGGLTSNYLCYDSTNREVVQATNLNFVNPVSFPLETATQTSVNFGSLNTGIWSIFANSINFSVAGAQRMDLAGSRLALNVPIQYPGGTQTTPPTGGTASHLDYYEETTFASGWTYENEAISSITMTINRIGKETTLYIPISVFNNFPSIFRPNAQITLPI